MDIEPERPTKRTRIENQDSSLQFTSNSNEGNSITQFNLPTPPNFLENVDAKENSAKILEQSLELNVPTEIIPKENTQIISDHINEQEGKTERKREINIAELLSAALSIRETHLRELLFLSQENTNILDIHENSSKLNQLLEEYHQNNSLFSSSINLKNNNNNNSNNNNNNKKEAPIQLISSNKSDAALPKIKISLKGTNTQNPFFSNGPSNGIYNTTNTSGISTISGQQLSSLLSTKVNSTGEDITSKASKDSDILKRINELEKEGLWGAKRLNKAAEPPRVKVHWDFLLSEMAWLAMDFKEERRWKMALAKKLAKQAQKYHEANHSKIEKQLKDDEIKIKKVAKNISSEVKKFWSKIEKVAQLKNQIEKDAIKRKQLDKQLDLLVVQTERFTQLVKSDLSSSTTPTTTSNVNITVPSSNVPPSSLESVNNNPPLQVTSSSSPVANEDPSIDKVTERENRIKSLKSLYNETEEKNLSSTIDDIDNEFIPSGPSSEDDEATIEQAEKELVSMETDLQKEEDELLALQRESEIPIEVLVEQYENMVSNKHLKKSKKQKKEKEVKEEIVETSEEEEENEEEEEEEDKEILEQKELIKQQADKSEKERITEAATTAKLVQPTGTTLSTTSVKTKVPYLLRGTLREYQHIGLDWLVTMYDKNLNGILADEMGLGKTIMTISLLAHLACEKGIWGPHLIIVPTSMMINWELEFKRWCPGFKIMTYFGSLKERKLKRVGWSKPNAFHICITSYKLVIQDQAAFRRKKWKYMILDEAHNIKNFRSQRWQSLLNFKSLHRLLLTGTPLQNSLMELWSLMHFLMPHVFQSHKEFKDWFANPVNNMIEGDQEVNEDIINRLHAVLRPFLLRRLKSEVEQQLPPKHHHIVPCKLSKRQRFLYEEFIESASTQKTLSSGNFLGIVNVLMQLRKVCNHPDLFEVRPIISPFDQMQSIVYHSASIISNIIDHSFSFLSFPISLASLDLSLLGLPFLSFEHLSTYESDRISQLIAPLQLLMNVQSSIHSTSSLHSPQSFLTSYKQYLEDKKNQEQLECIKHIAYLNTRRSNQRPLYGRNIIHLVKIEKPSDIHITAKNPRKYLEYSSILQNMIKTYEQRTFDLQEKEGIGLIEKFTCIIPKARAPPITCHFSHPSPSIVSNSNQFTETLISSLLPSIDIFRSSFVRLQLFFPDKRLIQFDSGKLQELADLLRSLKKGDHRALLFTQMTRMLDILEIFLNIHGYRYLRLDGSTKPEKRQMMMERFNKDKRIFLFILSTRSGGIGVNLTGADTVIFYDSDWNPAMDAQAQDRCHRIGQTREVHIYRMVTELSIEENILKKANQKRILEDVAIDSGGFTTDFFKSVDLRDLITSDSFKSNRSNKSEVNVTEQDWTKAISAVEEESDVIAMKDAQRDYSLSIVSDDFDDSSVSNIKIDANANDMDLHSISTEIETTITTTIDTNNNNNNNNNNNIEEDPFASELTPVQRYALRTIQSGRSVLESQRVIGKSLLFLFIDKDKGEVVSMETEEKGLNEQNEEKEKEEKTEKEGETSEKDSNYNKEDKDNDSDDDSVILPSSSSTSNNTTSSSSSSHGSNITSTNVSQSKQNENGSNSSNTSEKTRSNNEGKTTDSELKQKLKRKGRRKSTELFYEVKDINGKKDILKEELETIIYGDMSLIAPPNPDMGMTTNLLLSRGTVTKTASGLGASAVDLYGFGNSTPHLGDLYHYYDGEDYTSFGIGYGYIIDTDLYIPPLDDLEYIGLFPSKESTLDLPLEDTLDSLTLLNTIQKKKEQVKENNIKESAQQKGIQQIDVMQAIANVLANDQFIENSLISSMHVDHSHVILPTVQDVTPVKSEKIHKRKKIHVESEISFEISSAEGTESIKSTKTSEKSHKKIKQISPEPSSVSNKELEDSLDVPVIEDLEDSLDFPSTKKKKGEKKQKKEKEKTKKEKKKNTQKIQQPVDSNSLFDDSEFPMPSEDNNTSKKNRKNSRITVTTTNVNSSSSTVNSTAAPKTKRNRNAATTVITTSTNNTTTTTTSNNTNNNSTFITAPYTVTSDKDIKYSASLSNSNFGMKITNATDEIAPLPTPSSVFVHPWTLEEDKIINYAKSKYGMNWEIIADIVNSIPRVFIKRVRSKKHCSDHFKSISTNSSLDSDSSSSNVDSKDLLASYFQTTITNPTFSVSDLFKKIPPSASSNSPSSTSSTSSTGSPSLSSSNTVPIPSKQKGRSRSVSTNLSSNVLQNSNNITSAQGPSNPLNSTNISDSNFLTHTSHHTVASLAANIPFVTPQISGFKSRNPSDIALFKLQKERERREKEVHPITSNTISSVSSSSSMNSGNNSQSNNNLNTTLVHGNQQGFSSNPLLPHTNPVRSASSSNPSSVTQSLDAKFRMQSGSFPSHLQRNISPAFQGNIQDPNISPPNSRAVIPNQGLIRSASSPGIQSSNPNILSSNNMLASNSSSQHSLPSQSSIHGNFPPNTVVTGHPKTSSSNSTQPGMQMTVGLGIPMQSSMGNKISPGIPSNAAVHLNPGVRTSNSQKINILPNSAPNNTNNISVHPSFAHPMTANRQTNMGNQSSFSQPHFVTQANIVGSSQSIPIPINSSVTISPSVNPSHQFMQNVQAPQVFMPVHPTQKKT